MTVEIHKDCGTGYETLDNYMEGVWERSTKKKDVRQSIRCPGKIFICTRQDIWRSTSSMEEQGYGCC